MAQLTDPTILAHFKSALSEWRGTGGFVWTNRAQTWLQENLECDQREVQRLMCDHVARGGEITVWAESRQEWKDESSAHYDFVIEIEGKLRYIETRLKDESRIHPPHIFVVNMKDHTPR